MLKKISLFIGIFICVDIANTEVSFGGDKILVTYKTSSSFLTQDYRKENFQCQENDWEYLQKALIWVESKNNDLAVGKTHDGGCLQITPIYVEDCNRILKDNKFTLEDRFNRQKSLQMFAVIQTHYNPDRNLHKAIKLHNPGAGKAYRDSVLLHFNRYRNL